jgi:DNA mismatch repair ATPase MutS
MKYRNASEILPDELLKELQKYAPGEILYIPSDKKRKNWGAESGARHFYQKRNEEIREKYFDKKATVLQLSDEYNLTDETIKKIIYR